MESVSAALLLLLLAVASFLSNFAAARPGGPFQPCNTVFIANYTVSSSGSSDSANSSSFGFVSMCLDAFQEQPPPDLLQALFEEASHAFWSLLPDFGKVLVICIFIFFLVTVCCAFFAFFLRFVFRPILDALNNAYRRTRHDPRRWKWNLPHQSRV